jgi:hypothetical protein
MGTPTSNPESRANRPKDRAVLPVQLAALDERTRV